MVVAAYTLGRRSDQREPEAEMLQREAQPLLPICVGRRCRAEDAYC